MSVLTEKDVIEIRRMVCAGIKASDVSMIFGVTSSHIRSIHRRITWKHIKETDIG